MPEQHAITLYEYGFGNGRLLEATLGVTRWAAVRRFSEISEIATGSAFGAAASVATGVVVPEHIQIGARLLEWSGSTAEESWQYRRLDDACLRRFIRLVDAPASHIARFAGRYGPLFLGAGGYPVELRHLSQRQEEPPDPPPSGTP